MSLDLSNQVKNQVLHTLSIVMREAKREKLVAANPMKEIEPLASDARTRDILTIDELRRMFPPDPDELVRIWRQPKYAAFYFLLATSGIRSGEARALLWSRIAWERQGIFIVQAVKADQTVGPTKTGDIRAVLVPRQTIEMLEWYRGKAFWTGPADFVFAGRSGDRPLSQTMVSDGFAPSLRRAGIDTAGRNIVIHSLRHTYNTMMRRVLPEDLLREQTGHKSRKMTDNYDHPTLDHRLEHLQGVRKLIEGVWQIREVCP